MVKYLNENHIDTLWKKMAGIYGHKWVSGFGEVDDGTWLRGLQDLTPVALAVGLEACLKRADPWPPGLPEFRLLCLGLPDITTVIGNVMSNHHDPVSDAICKSIGSWDIQRMTITQLEARIKQIYPTALASVTEREVETLRDTHRLRIENKKSFSPGLIDG